jgi:geranylgeranyl pyrophosphate synthase
LPPRIPSAANDVVTADPLAAFLARARARVDAALERCLPSPPACPAIVSEAMRYSVFAGGKRLRPMLTLAAAAAVDTRSPEGLRHRPDVAQGAEDVAQGFSPAIDLALPAACAIELIHTYSLIHDDLPAMDDDTLRRGRPTLHVVYGDGIAILAGDGLHAEAFALLAREPVSDDPDVNRRKLEVIRRVGEAAGAAGMVGGQAIDLQAAGQAPGHAITLDADGLRGMHALKTGALIRASAVCGAVMAGADAALVAAIDAYADDVGLAFQIVDDILDVEGDPASLGKTAGKDAASDKPTYPALFGLDRSRALAAECLQRAHAALENAGITNSLLGGIADWVVSRKS